MEWSVMDISAVIITHNEEKNLTGCLEPLGFCKEVIIVDSGSTDNTIKIAKKYGAKVFKHVWQGYAKQKNFGIAKAKGKWILSLDADEVVTKELREEIIRKFREPEIRESGYFIARKNVYYGKWLRFGGLYPDHQLRLFKKGKGRYDNVPVHECLRVKGKTAHLSNPAIHYTKDSINEHIKYINKYTGLEAKVKLKRGYRPTGYSIIIKPCLYMIKHYFFKLGFLDGWQGLAYHAVSARYIFITEVKAWEKSGLNKINLMGTLFKRAK